MVNKAALGVLGVIVLVSMGVGVLIGMQLDGSPGVGSGNGTANNGGGPTPVPVTTGSTPTPIPTAPTPSAGSPTDQPPQVTTEEFPDRTTVPSRRFDASEIARIAKQLINERRVEAGYTELSIRGQTVDRLDRMARGHSVHMADAGYLSHNIEGNSSEDRYRMANLYSTCQFASDTGSYLITAESNNLEVITRTYAGRAFQDDSQTKFSENERQVAQEIVQNWFDGMISRPRLVYENAERVGVGVEVTRDGTVYATANVC